MTENEPRFSKPGGDRWRHRQEIIARAARFVHIKTTVCSTPTLVPHFGLDRSFPFVDNIPTLRHQLKTASESARSRSSPRRHSVSEACAVWYYQSDTISCQLDSWTRQLDTISCTAGGAGGSKKRKYGWCKGHIVISHQFNN